ncbi:MAG: hypothetical protein ACFE0J_19275 [Elainellaceae cyanobacterium]
MVRVRAPDLPQTGSWLNCDQSVSLKDLRGYVVILDFWTYSCINCLHVIPDVRYLEHKYGDRLVVIGIHTAKFDHEHTLESVRQAIARHGIMHPDGGRALDVDLNSPWDLVIVDAMIYVAMAGAHQIWAIDRDGTSQTLIGTGAEFCVNGTRDTAAFAQPSGTTTDGDDLFVVDSETSSVRRIKRGESPTAHTVCGSGQLFEFGDRDGIGSHVRLQHCLGLAYGAGYLWLADTYNHKIKRVHPVTGDCQTLCGMSKAGFRDGIGLDAAFSEPSGLSYADHHLYVADTNNHAIRMIDLDTLKVTTLHSPTLCSPYVCQP